MVDTVLKGEQGSHRGEGTLADGTHAGETTKGAGHTRLAGAERVRGGRQRWQTPHDERPFGPRNRGSSGRTRGGPVHSHGRENVVVTVQGPPRAAPGPGRGARRPVRPEDELGVTGDRRSAGDRASGGQETDTRAARSHPPVCAHVTQSCTRATRARTQVPVTATGQSEPEKPVGTWHCFRPQPRARPLRAGVPDASPLCTPHPSGAWLALRPLERLPFPTPLLSAPSRPFPDPLPRTDPRRSWAEARGEEQDAHTRGPRVRLCRETVQGN